MQALLEYLRDWHSPILRQCSFACVPATRKTSGPATAHELDSLLQQLPGRIDFTASFTDGKQIVESLPDEPDEDDFASTEEFQEAYDNFSPKAFDAKPWLNLPTSHARVAPTIASMMDWSINNKDYRVVSEDGTEKIVAFSRDLLEQDQIHKQEREHGRRVMAFANKAAELFSASSILQQFESNHQLDILNPPDTNPAECFEGCFRDETLAFVGDSHSLLIWVGYLRCYG